MNVQHRTPPASREGPRVDGSHSYLTSSFELRAGLDVSLVAIGQLPAEVLRELNRLRGCWGDLPREGLPAA